MSVPEPLLLFAGALFATVLLTALWLRLAPKSLFADIPNDRSAHAAPTLRGGGVAMVLALTASIFWLPLLSQWLIVCGLLVAIIGLIDDAYGVSIGQRLVVHFSAALLLVAPLVDTVSTPYSDFWLNLAVPLLAALFLVGMVNLYNFMDGVDGLAALQSVGFGVAIVLIGVPDLELAWCLIAVGLGFLVFNRPRARVFMGDVGSGYLGFMTGGVVIITAYQSLGYDNSSMLSFRTFMPSQTVAVLLPLMFFIADATLTLCWRIVNRQRFWEAHNQHVYQALNRERGTWTVLLVFLVYLAGLIGLSFLALDADVGFFTSALLLLLAALPLILARLWLAFTPAGRMLCPPRNPD